MRLSIIRVNWEICCWQQTILGSICSCAIAVQFCPHGFALASFVALPLVWQICTTFSRFLHLLLVQECSVFLVPCLFQSFAFSHAIMPHVVPAVSLALLSTISVTTNAILPSVQALGTPASTSISPQFCRLGDLGHHFVLHDIKYWSKKVVT